MALCLAAEACWQFELADYTSGFIQAKAPERQLPRSGAGEALKLQLLKMEAAYLARNDRHLEITKTVSVRQLREKDPAFDHINNQDFHRRQGLLDEGVRLEPTQPMFG